MKVLIVDLGSRLNAFGGQAKVAALLYKDLKRYFETYYLGYKTEYIGRGKNALILKRGKRLGLSLRKSKLSEIGILRLGYNLMIVRGLRNLGMPKQELARKILEIKPDVIIANSLQDIVLLRYLKHKGLAFKSVYIDHGSLSTGTTSGYFSKEGIPLTIGSGLVASSVKNAKMKFVNFFDMNIAINREQFASMKGMTDKVAYIPNGLAQPKMRSVRVEKELRQKFGISPDDFVVLYIGRMFERQKNVSTLIKAFSSINKGEMKLLLVGEGPSVPDYMKLADCDRRIIFTGSVEDSLVTHLYNIANVFVLPSNWEGFSLTMLEAAGHSLPLILSENAYVRDLKEKKIDNVISFRTKSPEDLRKKILIVNEDEKARSEAIRASKKITKEFSEDKMISAYRRLISGMID